jgi:hypothetical protein
MFNAEFLWKYGLGDHTLDAPDGSRTTNGFIFPDYISNHISLDVYRHNKNGLQTYASFHYDCTVYNFLMKVHNNPQGFLRIAPLHCTPKKFGRLMVLYMAQFTLATQPWSYEGPQGKEALLRDYAAFVYEKDNQTFENTHGMRRYRDDCQVEF